RDRSHHTLTGHTARVFPLAFSHDGAVLATGGADSMIKLWEVASQSEIATLEGHKGPLTDLAFTPDDKTLLSSSWDGTVKFWDIASHQFVESRKVSPPGQMETHLVLSPDGRLMATSDQKGVQSGRRGAVR